MMEADPLAPESLQMTAAPANNLTATSSETEQEILGKLLPISLPMETVR